VPRYLRRSSPWNLKIQRKNYVRFLRTRECLLIPLQIFFLGTVLVVLMLNAGKNHGLFEEKGREQATIDGLDAGCLHVPWEGKRWRTSVHLWAWWPPRTQLWRFWTVRISPLQRRCYLLPYCGPTRWPAITKFPPPSRWGAPPDMIEINPHVPAADLISYIHHHHHHQLACLPAGCLDLDRLIFSRKHVLTQRALGWFLPLWENCLTLSPRID
jgi:hypothetical protein